MVKGEGQTARRSGTTFEIMDTKFKEKKLIRTIRSLWTVFNLIVVHLQNLIPTCRPVYEIQALVSNPTTQRLALVGLNGVNVVELPRRPSTNKERNDAAGRTLCRYVVEWEVGAWRRTRVWTLTHPRGGGVLSY